jgi:hypothetical protein
MSRRGRLARATWTWIATGVLAAAASACAVRPYQQVPCHGDSSIFLLEAQAVPSATLIPCILPLPGGWSHGESRVSSGLVRFWLNSDRAGRHAVEVTLRQTCDVSRAVRLPAPTDGNSLQRYGLQRYEEPPASQPDATVRYFVFTGGCVRYRFSFTRQTAPALFEQADQFLSFTPRSVYVHGVRNDADLTLCGAEAPPCPG